MWLDPNRSYDIIGDVHGCADTLALLLEQMGYQLKGGVWQHPSRMALFLGDVIDRGPHIRQALHLVRNMVDKGHAICLMGNHEYYALAAVTPHPDDPTSFVRQMTPRNKRVALETIEQFEHYLDEWHAFTQWFYSLPLFIENDRFRLVHACWDQILIDQFKQDYPNQKITPEFIQKTLDWGSYEYDIVERLLLGLKLPLPEGRSVVSHDGFVRRMFRAKFWAMHPKTCHDVVFQPDALPLSVANTDLTPEQAALCSMYSVHDPLLFIGHYWCTGMPEPIQNNIACLDYSAVKYGKLVAYRLDNETHIDPNKFVWVEVKKTQ